MAEQSKKTKVTVSDVKQSKADQSKKNRQAGGKDVEVNILKTINVRFIKDYGLMKKDHTQRLSQLAFEVYDKNGCVEKIN